jgi:tetratricopeptide (TPR) repeat protein
MKTTIEVLVEQLQHVKEHGKRCSLLIGAGCSVTAGVPAAQGFVDIIKSKHGSRYAKAPEKTYGACMKQLPENVRRDLVARSIDEASLNWAHLGIAQLVAHGYVDRIYTTNFDPLILRACALVNQYPAVYDFAAATHFVPDMVPTPAVFYLHGQRSGFKLLHAPDELERHAEQIRPVFQRAGEGRMWIVVGYSGENDPLVERLAGAPHEYGIYWVGYQDNEPAASVRKTLDFDGETRCWLPGYDADRFFVELATRLGCFPPDLMGRPFSHLARTLEQLPSFSLPSGAGDYDPLRKAKEHVAQAIKDYEAEGATPTKATEFSIDQGMDASAMLMAGQYDEIIELRPEYESGKAPNLQEPLAWAYMMKGNALLAQAKTKTGAEADRLFTQAREKLAEALRIKPDRHEAFFNWGNALFAQAKTKTGAEADHLFAQAGEKYAEALRIKPDKHEALKNWGIALLLQAQTKTGAEADRLFGLASEKLSEAERIEPGTGSYNLACIAALTGRGEDCRQWLEQARQHGRLPGREHLESDTDLDPVRKQPWFTAFLESR